MKVNSSLRLSVVIVTLGRPDELRICLDHLARQVCPVDEIIVVDADPRRTAEAVVTANPTVHYVHFENGVGKMTEARNIGLRESRGDVVAYLDDDANATSRWSDRLYRIFNEQPGVGALGGTTLQNGRGGSGISPCQIARISTWGDFTGHFDESVHEAIEVDHLIGCNMAFRTRAIRGVGGFCSYFRDSCCTYEEVDLAIRLKNAGWSIWFDPEVRVDHCPGERITGPRFTARYVYGVTRNHCAVLVEHYGRLDRRSLLFPLKLILTGNRAILRLAKRDPIGAVAKKVCCIFGILVGFGIGGRFLERSL